MFDLEIIIVSSVDATPGNWVTFLNAGGRNNVALGHRAAWHYYSLAPPQVETG